MFDKRASFFRVQGRTRIIAESVHFAQQNNVMGQSSGFGSARELVLSMRAIFEIFVRFRSHVCSDRPGQDSYASAESIIYQQKIWRVT